MLATPRLTCRATDATCQVQGQAFHTCWLTLPYIQPTKWLPLPISFDTDAVRHKYITRLTTSTLNS